LKNVNERIAPLDGLRTIAALLVVGCHTAAIPLPFGKAGVWLFFVLSAFLLTKPFVRAGDRDVGAMLTTFYIRRAFRILPMYAVYVTSHGIWFSDHAFIADQLLHFQGYGHLWTINQELLFYVIMPVFILFLLPLGRSPLLCAGILAGKYLTPDVITVPAFSSSTATSAPFYLSPFLLGMATAFVEPSFAKLISRWRPSRVETALMSLVLLVMAASPHIYAGYFLDANSGAEMKALRMAVMYVPLLIWITTCPDNWLTKALSLKSMSKIGEAGYGFYLWHWLVMYTLMQYVHPGWGLFASTAIVTAVLARFTFLVVEKPFIKLGRWVSKDSLRRPGPDVVAVAGVEVRG
jgi:peptidoglycan/LPS O-acetylase OafA/YrhL